MHHAACVSAEFEQDLVRKTQCEVHIFDPTLPLATQQQLRLVKEFNFHDTGLIAEGPKVNSIPGHLKASSQLVRCFSCMLCRHA